MSEWWNETLTIENQAAKQRRLVALREELDAAHSAVQGIGMTNIAHMSPADRVNLDIASRRANDRLMAAYTAYQRALSE